MTNIVINNTNDALNIFSPFHVNVTYGPLLIKLLKVINYSIKFRTLLAAVPVKSGEIHGQNSLNMTEASRKKSIEIPLLHN